MGISATYYVDFVGGADANDGLSKSKPFKHSPGDPAAADKAQAAKLQPGDTIIFKGGVRYEGGVQLKGVSGEKGKPITFDGNTAGTFGEGRAIIDGGKLITDWKNCTKEQAGGNPNFAKFFYADLPAPRRVNRLRPWVTLNLCSEKGPLPVAQEPNPSDNIFQEDPKDYFLSPNRLANECPARIYPEKGTHVNSQRPLIPLITSARGSGVVSPIVGAGISVDLPEPVTVTAVGIMPQPKYPAVKEVAFYGDGKELLKATLEKDVNKIQKFKLPQPATFKKFTVKLLSVHGDVKQNWTAIARIAAFDKDDKDVMLFPVRMTLADGQHLKASDPHYYDGMTFGFHGGHNALIYVPVEGYDPQKHQLKLGLYTGKIYKTTRYCLLNSPKLIDMPGEYSVQPSADGKTLRVIAWPSALTDGKPAGLSRTVRAMGFELQQANHIRVDGFIIRQQGGRNACGVSARGSAEDVEVKNCEICWINGTGVTSYQVNKMVVEGCEIHDNPGHTKGVVLRNASGVAIRNTKAYRNTSTAMDFYTCSDSEMKGNVLWDNRGMHANGLTCYLGCKTILIESNYVCDGHVALTFQQIEGMTVRNNLFDGGGNTTVLGIWPTQPIKDVKIINNTIIGSKKDSVWRVGLFTNARKIDGLIVENNIIDGLYGERNGAGFSRGVFSNNIYTRPPRKYLPKGEGNVVETDLSKIFVNPSKGDYDVRPDGPAKGKGATLPKATWEVINAIPKAEKK